MSKLKRECLGDLTWRETRGVLSLSSGQPEILRRLLLELDSEDEALWACSESGNDTFPEVGVENVPKAPQWLLAWVGKVDFITLFSVAESDCIEGVVFLVCDTITKEYWFGVAGGLEEIFDYEEYPDKKLSKIQPAYGQRLWKIPVRGRDICAGDVYAMWSKLLQYNHDDLVYDLLGACKVYDRDLIPRDHMRRFILENSKSYFVEGTLGFNLFSDGPFVSLDEFVAGLYPDSNYPSDE